MDISGDLPVDICGRETTLNNSQNAEMRISPTKIVREDGKTQKGTKYGAD